MTPDEIRALMKQKIEEAGQILKLAKDGEGNERALTDEEDQRWKTLHSEADELRTRVERIEKQQEIEAAEEARLAAPTTEPLAQAPAAPSGGEPRIEFPKTTTRFKSIGEQLTAIALKSDTSMHSCDLVRKLDQYTTECRTAVTGATPSDGGFLLQQSFTSEIHERVFASGLLMPKTQRIPLSNPMSRGITIPTVDETSRADDSHLGGVLIRWIAEEGSITESDMKFGSLKMDLNEMAAAIPVTGEMLRDISALGAWVDSRLRTAMSWKIDKAIMEGTGAGQPLGVINSGAYIQVSKESSQDAETVLAENVINMYARQINPSAAEWYINQDVLPKLFKMGLAIGTGGTHVFMPAGGVSASPFNTLFGRPVNILEHCQTVGTVGDISFLDFSDYVMIDRGGIEAESSIHVYFLTNKQVFRFLWSVEGQPLTNTAITPAHGSSTLSPYVGLETRA